MHNSFDKAFTKIAELKNVVEGFDSRLVIADNTMAIIFKLLRIQYALCHQDELDKQDIFLMGAKEQANPGYQDPLDMPQNSLSSAIGKGGRSG